MLKSDEDIVEDIILKKGKNHQRILDVGCGDGEFLIEIAKKNKSAELWCTDLDVEDARNTIKEEDYSFRIKCIDAKAENIPLESHSFDFIYSARSLHEFSNPVKALKEIERVLTPDGEIIIIDWKRGADTGVKERYYKKEELLKFMKQAGFNSHNIKIKEVGRFNIISYSEGDLNG